MSPTRPEARVCTACGTASRPDQFHACGGFVEVRTAVALERIAAALEALVAREEV